MRKWIREHPKITSTIGGLAVIGGAYYYGVPPETSGPILKAVCVGLGLCG
jgi:hypothetical protein